MKLLIITEKYGDLKDYVDYLTENHSPIAVTELAQVRLSKKGFYSKTGMLFHLVVNFFYTFFALVGRHKFDFVVVHDLLVTLPYLVAAKICPRIKPTQHIIITFFFVHSLGTNRLVQSCLKFLLNDEKIILTVHSTVEKLFFTATVSITKGRVLFFPYCQDEVSADDSYGRGQNYIFSGGYSNRDYDCLMEAAKNVPYDFIIACSDLNKMPFQLPNVRILRNLGREAFNGYLKNSTVAVIPLKVDLGSSGQAVALSAMSLKKAIVYADIRGFEDYFANDVSGLAYKRGDASDLTSKITCLLSNDRKRNELGEEAFKRYSKNYHRSNYHALLSQLLLGQEVSDYPCEKKDSDFMMNV